MILLVLLGVLAAILLVSSFQKRTPAQADEAEAPAAETEPGLGTAAAILAGLVGYAFALENVGFLIATPLFLSGTLWWLLGSRRWKTAVITAGAVTLAVWLVFDVLLAASLPAGSLF